MSHNSKKTVFDKRRVDTTEDERAGVNHSHSCPVWRDDKGKDPRGPILHFTPLFLIRWIIGYRLMCGEHA